MVFGNFKIGLGHALRFFFFQAEDGIRDLTVTGVQTCALPICGGGGGARTARERGERGGGLGGGVGRGPARRAEGSRGGPARARAPALAGHGGGARRSGGRAQIGRASCRERV